MSIPSLEADGPTVTSAQDKAEFINQQFTSVFTHENTSTFPDLGASPFSTIVADNINVDGVEKLLAGLQSHKAHGPDIIWHHYLPIFTKRLCTSLDFPVTGKQLWCFQFIRKAHVRTRIITDQYLSLPYHVRFLSTKYTCQFIITLSILSDAQYGFRKNQSCET